MIKKISITLFFLFFLRAVWLVWWLWQLLNRLNTLCLVCTFRLWNLLWSVSFRHLTNFFASLAMKKQTLTSVFLLLNEKFCLCIRSNPWWGLYGLDSINDVLQMLDQAGIWDKWRPTTWKFSLQKILTSWWLIIHQRIYGQYIYQWSLALSFIKLSTPSASYLLQTSTFCLTFIQLQALEVSLRDLYSGLFNFQFASSFHQERSL